MKTVSLVRKSTGDDGTFGKAFTDERGYYTAELPWRDNRPGISCIPAGEYTCKWIFSPHHNRKLYHVQNVPGRTDVEIHRGNFAADTEKINPYNNEHFRSDVEGCILLGLSAEKIMGQMMLLQSSRAIDMFEKEMEQADFLLKISEEYGVQS